MIPDVFARGARPPRLAERLDGRVRLIEEVEAAAQARAMLNTSFAPLGAELMDRLPALELIASLGVGYDMIDVAAARARGIVVTHTPDVLNAEVAGYALTLMLAASRDLTAQDAHVRSGAWAAQGPLPLHRTLEGATFGIAGLGRIGRALARKLSVFDGTILYHGRHAQPDLPHEYCPDLVAMAARCDVLILLLPGGAATRGIVDAEVLAALGPEGLLVNVGRGEAVDEPALIAALSEGRLGRAALDVFADEPHVPEALRRLPNVLLSPHAASATVETRRAMFDLTADNLLAWAEGRVPPTPVPECADMIGKPGLG